MKIDYKENITLSLGNSKIVNVNERLNAHIYTQDDKGNPLPEKIIGLDHVDFEKMMFFKESTVKDIAKLLKK